MDAGGDVPRADGFEPDRWPGDARVVGLVVPSGGGPRACEIAAVTAEASGRRRRTLLANLAGDGPDLDGHLGATAGEGLFDAGRSGRSLREIAVRPPGRRFLYLPAGRANRSDDDAARATRARLVGLMARVAERVRDRGGLLLLFLTDEGGWPEALPDLLDGVVLADGAAVPAAWGDRAPKVLGRRPPVGEEPEADRLWPDTHPGPDRDDLPAAPDGILVGAAGGAGDAAGGDAGSSGEDPDVGPDAVPDGLEAPPVAGSETPGAWRRHRHASGLPWTRIAVGAAAIVTLAAGWWWFARKAATSSGAGGGAVPVEVVDDSAAAGAGGDARGTGGADGEGDRALPADDAPEGEAPAADAVDAAPELPYSVLIASYAQWPQARSRLEAWRDPSGPVYFVAPTRVRGGLYWRLFAGAVPDRASGEALMEELVERGRKDRARTWDVRPVGLAFLAGTAGSRSEARTRVGELEERGLPAYTLPAVAEGDTTWVVYAGGFESSEEASELRTLLREAEIEAELVTRRGVSDTR